MTVTAKKFSRQEQRTLFDLLTPKRPRLQSHHDQRTDSSTTATNTEQLGGCQAENNDGSTTTTALGGTPNDIRDFRPTLESGSGLSTGADHLSPTITHHDPSTDTSTTASNTELESSSDQGMSAATSSSSLLEMDPENSGSTTVNRMATREGTPNDIAKSRDCGPVRPMLRQFPKRMISGKLRSFSSQWYAPYPFIEYSIQTDAVYCYACQLFPPPRGHTEEVFTKTGFRDWKKIGERFQKHAQSEYHKHSMAIWAAYKQAKSQGSIAEQLDLQLSTVIRSNRNFLKTIAKVAILCARQNIALRGHDEQDTSTNKGNFLEILDVVATHNDELKHQLSSSPKNCKYTSNYSQNDILLAACDTILNRISMEVKQAGVYAIMADECRDVSRIEQLSVCVRYVSNGAITERFLGFTNMHELDAGALTEKIVSVLTDQGIDIKKCIAQCYDGASVMSGKRSGVQARFRDIAGSGCIYIHCYAHRLNLVIVDTARGIKEVNNFFGLMEAIYSFFSVSSLRHGRFTQAQKDKSIRVMEIPSLSDTRWVCRYAAVQLFLNRYECLILALESIVDESTDRSEAAEAVGLLAQLQEFSFIFFLQAFDCVLGLTKPLSDTLQTKQLDLATAIDLVDSTCKTLSDRRSEKYFEENLWKGCLTLAQSMNIEVAPPCTRKRLSRPPQRLQDSVITAPIGARDSENDTPLQFYRQRYFEILDRIIQELKLRFNDNRSIILSVASCNPKNDHFFSLDRVKPLAQESGIDLSKLAPQLEVAKNLLRSKGVETMEGVMKELLTLQHGFPEVYHLIMVALTIPVTSASAERSFSVLKRIKTYMRATMEQERLTHLAVLSIERELSRNLDLDLVVDRFRDMHPRRLQL